MDITIYLNSLWILELSFLSLSLLESLVVKAKRIRIAFFNCFSYFTF